MWAARPLVYEKNLKVKRSAIKEIAEEMAIKSDITQNISIKRSLVTEGRVQEILSEKRILIEGTDIQRERLAKKKEREEKEKESIYICPFFSNLPEEEKAKYGCHGSLLILSTKRDKIVSLRVAEDLDNALSYLAKRLDVPRSLLVSEILAMKARFPEALL